MSDRFSCCLVLAVVAVLVAPAGAQQLDDSSQRPNILFILADDLAWSDLGCYGHPWHDTPHLDRLAAEGVRFTDAYAPAPICSASRASILTGKTPARLQFEFVTKNEPGRQQPRPTQTLRAPPFTLNLPLAERTVAERLRDAGYATGFVGKWHLNAHHRGYLGWSPQFGPPQQGFVFAREGFGSHPYGYGKRREPKPVERAGEFPDDSLTRHACQFIREHREARFFLMVSHFYVHTPVHSRCRWLIEKYETHVPQDVPNRARRVQYAAFVETLDHYVGRLLSALDEVQLKDQTLVVFTSDNGGHPEYAANGPLRGSKWNLYEGGIRVPLIMRWPGQVPSGELAHTPVVGYDLLPTFAAVAEAAVEADEPLDGLSLVQTMRHPTGTSPPRDLYWHFPYYHPERGFRDSLPEIGIDDFAVSQTRPQSAVRRGDYKLLLFYEQDRRELYRLSDDLGEQQDLSARRPDVTSRLHASLDKYLNAVSARRPAPVEAGER